MARVYYLFLFVVPFLHSHFCVAQKIRFIEGNAGFIIFQATSPGNSNIRAGVASNSYGTFPSSLHSNYDISFVGIKGEAFFSRPKWSVSAGIKYTRGIGSIENHDNEFVDGNEYFFYRFKESDNESEYLTIKRIEQKTDYLGIPLEVRYFPFRPRRFNMFVKASAEINLNLHSETIVDFNNVNMIKHEDEVANDFRTPDRIAAIVFLAPGFHFGKPGKIKFGAEAPLPAFFVNTNAGGLVRPDVGGGFIVFVSVPLNKMRDE